MVKCLERLVLSFLLPSVAPFQDPSQYAYKCKRGVDDAISVFIDNIYRHIEGSKTFCRILFIDFSSAFNTIQPKILVQKLLDMKVNKHICSWIFDFLIYRPQLVKIKTNGNIFRSDKLILNVGAPQGTCISPALFTIYTDSCRSKFDIVNILKFADDTAIQCFFKENTYANDFLNYCSQISDFVSWCNSHSLQLNVSKTKEMIIDFRKNNSTHNKIFIKDQEVETVENYKYLGININNKLDWHTHAKSVISRINQRIHFVRKLNYFRIDKKLISLFYRSTVNSIISFCIGAWGGNTTEKDFKKINRIVKCATKLTGIDQDTFEEIFISTCINKFKRILRDPSHPLYNQIMFSNRSGRILFLKTRKERYRMSFLPYAVKLYSSLEHR